MNESTFRSTIFGKILFVMAIAVAGLMATTSVANADTGSEPDGQSEVSESAQVLFLTSPICPFCTTVDERDLRPLEEEYGDRLQILRVDTTTEEGGQLLRKTWQTFSVDRRRQGVPTVVIDDHLLVGAAEIPERLPGLIEQYLAAGGVGWPDIPGVETALSRVDLQLTEPAPPTWRDRLRADLPGNYVAFGLLLIMLGLLAALSWPRRWQYRLSEYVPFWLKMGTAAVGLMVALYLTYGETTDEDLVCGPIGQCNVVQNSDLAMLFGFFPLGLLGALAYMAILAVYGFGRWSKSPWARWAPLVALGLTGFGFLFSIMLTFWQPFIIGATCAWCLASAVTMSLCCLYNTGSGRQMLSEFVADGRGSRS
jgi:uncharacterized membrane protein